MAIKNPMHVKAVRDAVHTGLQVMAKHMGLGDRDLDGMDAVAGIALVLRDIIQSAPDTFTRHRLAANAIEQLQDAANPSVIVPARTVPKVNGA